LVSFEDVFSGNAGYRMTVTVAPPFLCSVGKIFAFPDGHFMFDPVDDITVGIIRFFPVRGSGDYHNGAFTNSYLACSVLCHCDIQVPF